MSGTERLRFELDSTEPCDWFVHWRAIELLMAMANVLLLVEPARSCVPELLRLRHDVSVELHGLS